MTFIELRTFVLVCDDCGGHVSVQTHTKQIQMPRGWTERPNLLALSDAPPKLHRCPECSAIAK